MSINSNFQIIVHSPQTEEKKKQLSQELARIHDDAVKQYIQNLSCSVKQKNELLHAVIQAAKEEKSR